MEAYVTTKFLAERKHLPSDQVSSSAWFGMSRAKLAQGLRGLADDLERGTPAPGCPTVTLADWTLARRAVPCLIGYPVGHPNIEDQNPLFSSEVFFLDAERRFARTFSRWYSLGQMAQSEFWDQQFGAHQ